MTIETRKKSRKRAQSSPSPGKPGSEGAANNEVISDQLYFLSSGKDFEELPTLSIVRASATSSLESLQLTLEERVIEVDVLLGYVFGLSRVQLIGSLGDPPPSLFSRSRSVGQSAGQRAGSELMGAGELPNDDPHDWYRSRLNLFSQLLARRQQHEPIAYIVGKREFYGRSFEVGPGVLIPRPETELIVDTVLNWLKQVQKSATAVPIGPLAFCDLGVGSGAILVTLLAEISKHLNSRSSEPPVEISALGLDLSEIALRYTAENLRRHVLEHSLIQEERIELRRASFMANVALPFPQATRTTVIVSNPPYIDQAEAEDLPEDVRLYEPALALYADNKGLAAVEHVLTRCFEFWESSSSSRQLLVCEFGASQGVEVLARASEFRDVRGARARGSVLNPKVLQDLAGRDRVLVWEWIDHALLSDP